VGKKVVAILGTYRKGGALDTAVEAILAALVATSAMPGFLIPLATGTMTALRMTARILGARPVAGLWIGHCGGEPDHQPDP
jgi:hypothetical protein